MPTQDVTISRVVSLAPEHAELVRIEQRRLRSLVDGDVAVAERIHADDFQLITPGGDAYSKAQYLGDIASGVIDYRVWEPLTSRCMSVEMPVASVTTRTSRSSSRVVTSP